LFSFWGPITYLRRAPTKSKSISQNEWERINGVPTNEESYQNSELTWTLVFFSFWALITPTKSSHNGKKSNLKWEQKKKDVVVNQEPHEMQELT